MENYDLSKVLNHYLESSTFTNAGNYKYYLKNDLPNNIKDIGSLVRKQLIHRVTLKNGNTGTNTDMRYGDMTKVPWYRQSEDDIFPTASAMLAELFRRDSRGLVNDRREENKLILTCRFVSVLMASILKAKGIPTRVRSGFASYFDVSNKPNNKSGDHWINQYWRKEDNRWITIDVDGSFEDYIKFDPYDIPENVFDFSADAWLRVRNGEVEANHFYNDSGDSGLITVAWELFYDFHCLMNDELIYLHVPEMTHLGKFEKLTEDQLKDIDELAKLMREPDKNFDRLIEIWKTKKEFRLVKGGLI